MEDYTYKYKQFQLHWKVRLHSFVAAYFDRRTLLKQFERKLNLGEIGENGELPESYMVDMNEIKYLHNIRNKILVRCHEKDYAVKQVAIDKRMNELKQESNNLRIRLEFEQQKLEDFKAKCKAEKNPANKVVAQAGMSECKTKIKNMKIELNGKVAEEENLQKLKVANLESWKKQVKFTEETIAMAARAYVKRATRLVEKKYGLSTYEYNKRSYDAEMMKQINGEY